ncbi:putative receptor-like cytosolic serine/threonine-protein kinase RBK1 isoform X1 [Iris pallida]|uniref:Receptor-like cytosolic serine/threonine-protein kinase RBK1 isoform X1 n=1 Tax=Iris pallida TaxID=29817 RepID=A0AAX6FU59_IRIPA|nr:putative receptor-like cytosolic serine/threonine-protein kinase RBK1 isoform X1 [Iris pallida]
MLLLSIPISSNPLLLFRASVRGGSSRRSHHPHSPLPSPLLLLSLLFLLLLLFSLLFHPKLGLGFRHSNLVALCRSLGLQFEEYSSVVDEWCKKMPIITRLYLTVVVVTTSGCFLKIRVFLCG